MYVIYVLFNLLLFWVNYVFRPSSIVRFCF